MKIGFIGAGNMATALLGGILKSGVVNPCDAAISDKFADKLTEWENMGVFVTDNNAEVEAFADVIVFAVKPNIIPSVLEQMQGDCNKIYISIAAGVSLDFLEKSLGSDKKIVRTMPNTPALVGCGMTAVAPNSNVSEREADVVIDLLSNVGDALVMSEKDLEIATAIHGSSPAYIYMMIDAMADAGVRHGLTKKTALALAAKATEGSAKMVMETGKHPGQLKDEVCSPGGTTIAAVCELEKQGFTAAVQAAVDACVERNNEMKQ